MWTQKPTTNSNAEEGYEQCLNKKKKEVAKRGLRYDACCAAAVWTPTSYLPTSLTCQC